MADGYVPIAIIQDGQQIDVQRWPRLTDSTGLHAACKKYKATAWVASWEEESTKMLIHVENVEIEYRSSPVSNPEVWDFVQYQPSPGSAAYYSDGPTSSSSLGTHSALAARLRSAMPGLHQQVDLPCGCTDDRGHALHRSVWGAIQHLNDRHHPATRPDNAWTRERIAQWTENLPFDLTIDPEEATRPTLHPRHTPSEISAQMEAIAKTASELKPNMDGLLQTVATTSKHFALLSMTMDKVDPKTFEIMTGMKHPGDPKEES